MTDLVDRQVTAETHRDNCLRELDGFYEHIEAAATSGELDVLAELVAQRGEALDRFMEAHAAAPLGDEARRLLLLREEQCQRLVAEAAETIRTDLMQVRRRGLAARRYAKDR